MEEVSFRSGAAALGGVLAAAGAAITLAVVLGGPGDAVASAPASPRRAPLGGVRVAGARSPPRRRPPRGPAGRRSPRPWPEITGRRGPRPGHRPPGAPRRRRCPAAPQRRVRSTGVAARPPAPPGAARLAGLARLARPWPWRWVAASPPALTAGLARIIVLEPRDAYSGRDSGFPAFPDIPVAGDPRPHPVRLLGYGVDVPAMSPQVRVAKQPASFGARLPASDATAVTALGLRALHPQSGDFDSVIAGRRGHPRRCRHTPRIH